MKIHIGDYFILFLAVIVAGIVWNTLFMRVRVIELQQQVIEEQRASSKISDRIYAADPKTSSEAEITAERLPTSVVE